MLAIAAAVLCVACVQLPTATINVPLNNALQRLTPDTMDAAALKRARDAFEPRWNRWNAFRTACATLASLLLLLVLIRVGHAARVTRANLWGPAMPQPAIHVAGIRKAYGRTVAVDDVSFDVQPGEIFGLIGPNGAGKTTTMECVEGLRAADRGTIAVLGLDPARDAVALQQRIGVQLQEAQLQKRIKVWEAVDFWASLYRSAVDGDRLLDQLGLTAKRDAWFMTLSGGQKQRLFIALALDQRSGARVPRRADDRSRSAGAAGHLGPRARHPRARQDGVPDDAPHGGGGAPLRPDRDHRPRPHRRHRGAGRSRQPALPRSHGRRHHRRSDSPRPGSAPSRASTTRRRATVRSSRSAAAAPTW